MKGLYQLLAEDYREQQLRGPIIKNSKQLIESTRPSKLKKKKALKESTRLNRPIGKLNKRLFSEADKKRKDAENCKDEECKEEVIKGAEEIEDKKPIVEDEKIEEIAIEEPVGEELPVEEIAGEEVVEGPTALEKISEVADLTKEDIEAEIAEMTDEEKEAIKGKFEAIKNIAMELFPEEVEEDIEEIKEEVPEEVEEEPLEECEISSFKVVRIAPKFNAVMIEAQTKEGLKYITGKSFNETEKTLEEAEISTDKMAAANRFKSLLK